MVYRVRKQLLEEGFEAVLSSKQRATPAVVRIFDGEKEAKLDCAGLFQTSQGTRALDLAAVRVVELQIVDRASDSTIGRALKQTFSSLGLDHFEGRSWTGLHPMAPHPRGHEMVQLVILAWCQPRRHWLDALAIARSNQPRDISGHIRRRAL
jgi:hypothetical protein